MKVQTLLHLSALLVAALPSRGATLLESDEFFVDLRESPRVARAAEPLTFSTRWNDALAGCTRKARFEAVGYRGMETLTNVPVLVRLSSAISGFDYADFAEGATDLVFCDEAEATVFPHEIDEWNPNGESLIWVRLPVLEAGTVFKAGWGGLAATAAETAATAHAVWSDYAGVWHMNEASGTAFDSTTNGLDAVPGFGANGSAATLAQIVACEDGACGRARVNATTNIKKGNYMQAPSYDALGMGDEFSVSIWFRGSVPENYPRLVSRKNANEDAGGFEIALTTDGRFDVRGGSADATDKYLLPPFSDTWVNLVVSFQGRDLFCYTNGSVFATLPDSIAAAGDNGTPLAFGNKPSGNGNIVSFVGQYDEIRLRGGTLSADRIRADYDMIANPGFVTCGAVETIATSGVEIRLDGEVFAGPFSGEGTVSWAPAKPGTYEFEHMSLVGGEAVATESASFVVPGPADDDLSIVAESDLVEGVSIRLGGVPDGWTLHYTTDGTTPTADSPVYEGPFTLADSATVKVVAVNDDFGWTTGVAEQRFDLAPPLAVTGAQARQRYPWNGLVDVDFTLAGDTAKCYRVSLDVTDLDGGTNLAARTVWEDGGTLTNTVLDVAPGAHRFVWNAGADLPEGFVADRLAVSLRAEYLHDTALYMVVDLSGGPDAAHYPVSYLPDVPEGGWTDEYKTDKLVLRRVEPGWFTMGTRDTDYPGATNAGIHHVTLTKPMYSAVFETTQKQWANIMGMVESAWPGDTRPVFGSYSDFRGSELGAQWPNSDLVDADSFLGKLRVRTELVQFDLPTEAEWEYVCRAGTESALNSGLNLRDKGRCSNAVIVGRYGFNSGWVWSEQDNDNIQEGSWDGVGGFDHLAVVGAYEANRWGLYDMHGNAWETCLDWVGTVSVENAVNPSGAPTGTRRVIRGGSWNSWAFELRSGHQGKSFSNAPNGNSPGFRLFLHDAPAVVEAPIVAPEGLVATTNRTGDVTLSWEPVAGAYAYQIRRSKTGAFEDGTWLNTVTNTTYADWTAVARTNYTYWVRAQFESGKVGRWSETAEGCRCELAAQNAPYMVIDLSGGSSASSYPVSYLDAVPEGGWTDEYKTTKMVFRKVEAGTFTMGSPSSESGRGSNETQHQVTITKPFFISVFEMTEKQHAQIAGGSATSKKPIKLEYSAVRGEDVKYTYSKTNGSGIAPDVEYDCTYTFSASSYCWPNSKSIDSSSVVGKLKSRTQTMGIDLPTEAQWEYACRCGHTGSGAYGGSVGFSTLKEVGTSSPSGIGLYDMVGNATEWCLDVCNSNSAIPDYGGSATTNPAGPKATVFRYYVDYLDASLRRGQKSGTGSFTLRGRTGPKIYTMEKYTYRLVRGNSSRPASRSMSKSVTATAGVRLVVTME